MKDYKIKYDQRTVKLMLYVAIIWSIVIILVVAPSFIPIDIFDNQLERNDTYLVVLVLSLYSIIPLCFLWVGYIDGKWYLKKLETVGYEVPYDKNDYGCVLDNLPKVHDIDPQNNGRDKETLILSYIAIFGAIIIVLAALDYYLKWKFIVSESELLFMAGGVLLLAGLWLIGALVYYKRSDNTRYRNFYVVDSRKRRNTFAGGILTMLITGAISIVIVSMSNSMTRYVAKTKISNDVNTIYDWVKEVELFYSENEYCQEEEWSDSYQKLQEGVDFFEVNWDDDMFSRHFINKYDIGDIYDLKNELRATDGHFYIRYSSSEIEVYYTYKWEYGKEEKNTFRF